VTESGWWPRFYDSAFRPDLRTAVILHWRANLLMLRSPRAIVGFLVLSSWPALLYLTAIWLIVFLGERTNNGSPFVGGPVVGVVVVLAITVGYLLLQHIAFSKALLLTYAPFVRKAMRERGHPICLRCGQLLHASDADRCPECGSSSA
jgi:hypothetical protein